ncbi:Clp amino terminal domain-containing protein, pathogenicity island component [Microbacterium sp. LKL04]|nr:Clp amino terminal domain-containing protein, pathogenicity island component [Microbacterium sp. LKL04]
MSRMTTAMGNAHRLTRYAMEEASRTGRTELGVEHLFLALTLDEADAGQVLRAAGATIAAAREAVAAEEAAHLAALGAAGAGLAPGPIAVGPSAGWAWSPVAERVLTSPGDGTSAGILRRLLDEPSGAIEALLRRLNMTADDLRARLDAAAGLPPVTTARRRHPLARSAASFVAAPVDETWALVSDPERLPEWEDSVDHVSAAPDGDWVATPRDDVETRPAFRRLSISRTMDADTHHVTWTFRYPDAPKANARRIGLRLEPAAGGTTVHIDYSWERTYRRRRSGLGWMMAPLYRVALAMQVARVGAAIGAAVR